MLNEVSGMAMIPGNSVVLMSIRTMRRLSSRKRRLGALIEAVPRHGDPEVVIARPETVVEGLARAIDDMRAGPYKAQACER